MPWPTVPVVTTNMDANADSPLSARSDILDLTTKFNDLIAMRGVANGVASLDANGRVPAAQIPFRGVLARAAASQTLVGSSAANVITFTTEDYDTESAHETVSNTSRITIPTGVTKAIFFGGVEASITDGDSVRLLLVRNGSTGNVNPGAGVSGKGTSFTVDLYTFSSPVMLVTSGDYFEIWFYYSGAAGTSTIAQGTCLGMRVVE